MLTRPGKRNPGLRLSQEHLQPAVVAPSPNSSNGKFREHLGHLVSGNRVQPPSYEEQPEESIAATFLNSRNQCLPTREPPQPPIASSLPSQPASGMMDATQIPITITTTPAASMPSTNGDPMMESTEDHMEVKVEDLETLGRLGEGAAGTVRKVRHRPTQMIMAKKSISTDPDPSVQRQILRELAFLKTCHSPYIVSFYGAFLDDGDTTVSLCMEYCEAGSLEDIYKRAKDLGGVIGEPVLERIAESVCKGLVYLHQKRVIHRDIKPSNIVVTRQGDIKLCDFGVSGELINSLAQTFTGTQYYMAPERIQGNAYAVQSDIWSLGLTLIEVSQNQPALPPPGQPHLSIFELLDHIVRQPVPEIQGDHLSDECKHFVALCLKKDPRHRPTPSEMLKHPFITMWEHQTINVGQWVQDVWGFPPLA